MRQASFRGVDFSWVDAPRQFGRNTAEHVYPDRVDSDGNAVESRPPWVEDPSGRVRTFPMTVVFVGDDCETQADKFVAACETPGPGRLVHPILGELDAICETGSQTIDQTNGEARLEVTFKECGRADLAAEQSTATSVPSASLAAAVRAAAHARAMLNRAASMAESIATATDVLTDAMATVRDIMVAVGSPALASTIKGRVIALTASAAALAETPEDIADAWDTLFADTSSADCMASIADLSAVTSTDEYGDAVAQAIVISTAGAACNAAIANPGETNLDADAQASALTASLITAADLAHTPDQRADLVGLASVSASALRRIAGTLPRVEVITIRRPTPLLTLVADLFPGQDPERAALAILRRNPRVNALFVPAGTLEVVNA